MIPKARLVSVAGRPLAVPNESVMFWSDCVVPDAVGVTEALLSTGVCGALGTTYETLVVLDAVTVKSPSSMLGVTPDTLICEPTLGAMVPPSALRATVPVPVAPGLVMAAAVKVAVVGWSAPHDPGLLGSANETDSSNEPLVMGCWLAAVV